MNLSYIMEINSYRNGDTENPIAARRKLVILARLSFGDL